MSKFCLAMDNYCSLPMKVVVALRDIRIVMGIARYCGSCPPKELKNVSKVRPNPMSFTGLLMNLALSLHLGRIMVWYSVSAQYIRWEIESKG